MASKHEWSVYFSSLYFFSTVCYGKSEFHRTKFCNCHESHIFIMGRTFLPYITWNLLCMPVQTLHCLLGDLKSVFIYFLFSNLKGDYVLSHHFDYSILNGFNFKQFLFIGFSSTCLKPMTQRLRKLIDSYLCCYKAFTTFLSSA